MTAAKKTAPRAKKAAPRQPQDHKKPAKRVADEAKPDYRFTHQGREYFLPHAQKYVTATSGGDFMDAVLDENAGDIRLAMLALRSAKADIDADAFTALRSKSLPEFVDIVNDWIERAQGAALGESEG